MESAQTRANLAIPSDPEADYGVADFNRTNSFVVSWLYTLPIHFSNRVANSLLGGWTLTAIQTVQSGLPLTFFMGTDVAVDGTGGAQYAEFASGAGPSSIPISHPNRRSEVEKCFNTQAFENPNLVPIGTYGNSRRAMATGPAYVNTDASILKDFILPRSLKFEFRLESFNTLNQVNFSKPDTTANDGSFGQILSTQNGVGRQLQLAAKLLW